MRLKLTYPRVLLLASFRCTTSSFISSCGKLEPLVSVLKSGVRNGAYLKGPNSSFKQGRRFNLISKIKIPCLTATIASTVTLLVKKKIIHCEALVRPQRDDCLTTIPPTEKFDWKKFWAFLKPELLWLFGAIVVSLCMSSSAIEIFFITPCPLGPLLLV